MKKLFVLLLTVIIAIPVMSQVNFGLKVGASTTSITMADAKTITSGSASYLVKKAEGSSFGFHAGAFLRLNVSKLYIQPELLFATRSNEYTVTNVSTSVDSLKKQSFNKLDLPIMIGVKLGPVRINAGPVGSLLINSPADLISDPDFKAMYSRLTVGYQAGLGVDLLKKVTVDLRYEGSLKKYQNQIQNLAGNKIALDDRPNAFLLSLGIMF